MDIDFLSRRRRCSTLSSCIDPEKNWKLRRQTASLLLPEDRLSAQIIEDSTRHCPGACQDPQRLGQRGGLPLAKSAKAIGLGEVIRHTEPDMAIATCFEPVNAPCAILPYCVLRICIPPGTSSEEFVHELGLAWLPLFALV
jgi:hypothetical protein